MINVISYTGFEETASSRFRVREFTDFFSLEDINLFDRSLGKRSFIKRVLLRLSIDGFFEFRPILRSNLNAEPDIIIAERQYFSYEEISRYRCPKIFVIDDLDFPDKKCLELFDGFITSNQTLQDDLEAILGNIDPMRKLILPTVVDTKRFLSIKSIFLDKFTIVWSGYAKNFKYFDVMGDALLNFMRDYPKTKLRIISEKLPDLKNLNSNQIEWVRWDVDSEVQGLVGADIGIMPLHASEFEKRKAGFKIIQYLSSGIPALASPVGVNVNILSPYSNHEPCLPVEPDDWYSALLYYYRRKFTIKDEMSSFNYRQHIIDNYSIESVGPSFVNFVSNFVKN